MTTWISQEAATKALFNLYHRIGLNITYEQVAVKIQEKCDSGEIPSIHIPYYMKDKADLN